MRVLMFALLTTTAQAGDFTPPTIPSNYGLPYTYCTEAAQRIENRHKVLICTEWQIFCPRGSPIQLPGSGVVVCPRPPSPPSP